LKTRLQSPQGFVKSGGFRGIYNGVGAAFVGSAPGAALFFSVYETLKARINNGNSTTDDSSILLNDPAVGHILAASAGEAAACLVRVPTEVIKQNMQIISHSEDGKVVNKKSMVETFNMILAQKDKSFASNLFGGLYRGYGITLMREVPFAFIQFPLYERFKLYWSNHLHSKQSKDFNVEEVQLSSAQAAVCGSVSGGIAAAATTPLDVIKTRLMIGKDANGVLYKGAFDTGRRVLKEEGWRKLLSGIEPRVFWISIGGFVFFGAYEECRSILL
jgi:solute carrier family 25 S-adenosylmethionine transporter 26